MTGKRRWLRPIIFLLIVSLLPFAHFAGFTFQSAKAAQSDVTAFLYSGESYFDENIAYLSIIVTDNSYSAEPRLYSVSDQTEIEEFGFYKYDTILYYDYYRLNAELWSGDFVLYLDLKKDGVVETTVPIGFTVPDKQPFSVYLFGPTAPITDLFFYNPVKEYSVNEITYTEGNGYVKYTIDAYPGACFTLEDVEYDYVFSNRDWLCARDGWEHVVHATDGDFAVDLLDYEVEMQNGEISGWVRFDEAGSPPLGNYRLSVVDQNGTDWFCAWVEPEVEMQIHFECEDVPADPSMLRIDLVVDEVYIYPTNAALMLEAVDLPDTEAIADMNPELGRVEAVVQFSGSDDEPEIALYKIVPPYDPEFGYPHNVVYVPADGSVPYIAVMEEFQAFLGDSLSLRMIDTLGSEYVHALDIPVIDKMFALEDLFNYEDYGCSGEVIPLSYSCYSMDPLQNVPDPEDAGFSAGQISWTVQDVNDFIIAGYDIYLADADQKIIRGDARINLLPGGQQQITHALENVPEDAEYAAVVTLLVQPDEYYDSDGEIGVYYSEEPFFIELSSPAPSELVLSSSFIRLDDGAYGYVPKGMTAGELIARFELVDGTDARVLGPDDHELGPNEQVTPGAKLVLTLGETEEVIGFRFLSELLRPSEAEAVTISHITVFVILQLNAKDPVDVTGDDVFDGRDVRLLLEELEM